MRGRAVPLRHALPALLLWGLWCALGCELLVDDKVSSYHCTAENFIGPPACPEHSVCKHQSCVLLSAVEQATGSPCEEDANCPAGDVCLDPTILGDEGPRRCSHPCCASSDCDASRGLVCWSPPLGGPSFCRAADVLNLPALGTGTAGSPCHTGHDCRSGRCDDAGTCLDGCCTDAHCEGGAGACRFGVRDGNMGFFCGPKPPQDLDNPLGIFGAICAKDEECASGLCLVFGDNVSRCSKPCCASSACDEYTETHGRKLATSCAEVLHQPESGAPVHVRACVGPADRTLAGGDIGAPCTTNVACRSGLCLGAPSGYCSDACCTNQACANPDSFACRLYGLPSPDGAWALRCEHK